MEQTSEFIGAIGALAETAATFYKALIGQDIPAETAIALTGAFISATMQRGGKSDGQAE